MRRLCLCRAASVSAAPRSAPARLGVGSWLGVGWAVFAAREPGNVPFFPGWPRLAAARSDSAQGPAISGVGWSGSIRRRCARATSILPTLRDNSGTHLTANCGDQARPDRAYTASEPPHVSDILIRLQWAAINGEFAANLGEIGSAQNTDMINHTFAIFNELLSKISILVHSIIFSNVAGLLKPWSVSRFQKESTIQCVYVSIYSDGG